MAKKKVKRIVLGIGHPWYGISERGKGSYEYDSVHLTTKPVATSILLRGGESTVKLKYRDTGNWNKVRLVMEVLK